METQAFSSSEDPMILDREIGHKRQLLNVISVGRAINDTFASTIGLLRQVIPTASAFVRDGYDREIEDLLYVREELLSSLGINLDYYVRQRWDAIARGEDSSGYHR